MKAVLFDLDGVLVDAAPWHETAFRQAVLLVTGTPLSHEDHARWLEGRPTRTKLALLLERGRVQASQVDRIAEEKQRLTREVVLAQGRPDPARVALVQWASRQWQVGCVTNCTQENADLLLRQTELLPHVALVITSSDVSFPKPDPFAYWHACGRLRVRPAEALAIEDHLVGVEAARAAGCRVWHLQAYHDLTQEALTEWMAPSS